MSYIGNKPTAVPLTSADIEDGVISAADLGANSVDSSELVDGSIDTSHLGDNQVTLAKMAGLARGKLIYGDASGDPAALAVGGADEVLTHDGTDFDWAAAGGGGKVLQAVTTQLTTGSATSSTSWFATGLTVDITPSATSSKVLVLVTESSLYKDAGGNFHFTINRDATNLGHATYGYMYGYGKGEGETFCATILDSPSTTSAVTYEVYAKCTAGTLYWSNGPAYSNITAIEIGA